MERVSTQVDNGSASDCRDHYGSFDADDDGLLGPLNAFLGRAVEAVRRVYHGPVSYASLVWEAVNWSRFDIIGVDHYREPRINDRYVDMLAPPFAHGKPVVVTEFGCRTYQGADSAGSTGSFGMVDTRGSSSTSCRSLVGWCALGWPVRTCATRRCRRAS